MIDRTNLPHLVEAFNSKPGSDAGEDRVPTSGFAMGEKLMAVATPEVAAGSIQEPPAQANPDDAAGVTIGLNWRADLPTLAAVRDLALSSASGNRAADIRSAFALLEKRLLVDLGATPATAPALRRILDQADPMELGISEKRLANAQSVIRSVVRGYGPLPRRITPRATMTPAWQTLIERVPNKRYGWGLSRLAGYCSACGTAPETVTIETLRGFFEALVEEELVQDPRNVLKRTIALWNMQARTVPGWPQSMLATPFGRTIVAKPLEAFPPSFADDVAAWERAMTSPDPFDLAAPAKALRSTTIDGIRLRIRTFASRLVEAGIVQLADMASMRVFFEADHLQRGLRLFAAMDADGRLHTTRVAHRMAATLGGIARQYLRLEARRLEEITVLVSRLDPGTNRGMGERSRRRLEQFDDEDAKRRLLTFPETHMRRALDRKGPLRRAQTFEQALAAAILIDTCLRIENLVTIRLDQHIERMRDGIVIRVPAVEVKNEVPLDLPLSYATAAMLDRFVAEFRPALPGSEGAFLFAGKNGGAKSTSAMRQSLSAPIKKHTGLDLTPHTFRHAIGKILVDENPALIAAVSQRLGHRSISTTLENYVGSQSRAAGRKLASILDEVRDREPQADTKGVRNRRASRGSDTANSSKSNAVHDRLQGDAAVQPARPLSATGGADTRGRRMRRKAADHPAID